MGRGASERHEIYPGRPDLDRRHRTMVSIRAKRFLRRNPELKSFAAVDLVADRDSLSEEELQKRAASITKGLVQLVDVGLVAIVDESPEGPAYALTEANAGGMGDDEVAAILR